MERNGKKPWALAACLVAAALAACGGPEDRKTTYIERGTALYEAANYHEARLEFKNALQIDPQDTMALYLGGQVLEKLEDWRGAVGNYQHVLELDPTHVDARVRLEQLYQAHQAQQITPDSVDSLLALAKGYLAKNKPAEALRVLEQFLNHARANVDAHDMTGVVLAREEKQRQPEAQFREAIALDPTSVKAYRNLGRVHWGRGDTTGAIQAYREGLEKTSGASSLAYELAVRYEQLGELDLAISEYELILSKDPIYGPAANNLAMLLATHKEDPKSLDRALQLTERFRVSKHPELVDTLGWVHYKRSELDEAVQFLEQAVQASPDNPEMRYHLGMAYQSKGEIALARRQLATALESNVSFRGIEEARRTLQMLTAQ